MYIKSKKLEFFLFLFKSLYNCIELNNYENKLYWLNKCKDNILKEKKKINININNMKKYDKNIIKNINN